MTLLLLLAVLPTPGVVCDRVDLVEVNHVHNEQGNPTITQLIFWQHGHVRAWRLLKHCNHRPEHDAHRGEWVTIFQDGGLLREVRSTAFRESWTQYDVERIERDRLPQEWRAGLLFERQPVLVEETWSH